MQLFVNDLTVIDFSYLCAKRGVIGESWIVDLTLIGSLDEQSMVLDFAKVKKQAKRIIDDVFDHKLVVPSKAPQATIEQTSEGAVVNFSSEASGPIGVFMPLDGYAFVEVEALTLENAAEFLSQKILSELPENVEKVLLNLRPENIDGFYYHYTHGLKKHDGNCQRITHGHRSKVQVLENGMKSPRLQKYWADRWQDIYLASSEDSIAESELKFIRPVATDKKMLSFAYEASQGYFELWIADCCTEVVPVDTTVECLAEFMNAELVKLNSDATYQVTAFEGVAKGAIV